MVDFSDVIRMSKDDDEEFESPEITEPFSLKTEDIEKNRKEFGATIPVAIKRMMGETTSEWVARCYEEDPRFTKVTSNFFGSGETAYKKDKRIIPEGFF